MHGSTFLLGPSIFDRRKARKILIFSLSLSIRFSSLSFLVCLSFPPPFPFLSFRIPPNSHFLYVYSSLIFSSHFPFLFSSHFLLFLFLFFFSFLFSYYLILIHPPNLSKSGGNFPHFPPCHMSSPCFSSLFSFSLLLHHVTHDLM